MNMKKSVYHHTLFGIITVFAILASMCSCSSESSKAKQTQQVSGNLRNENLCRQLDSLVVNTPGVVGVAIVSDNDTITVNNDLTYAMMSVFKMHQALAVANHLERTGRNLDDTLRISAAELDRDTWSPMLKHYGNDGDFTITIGQLMRYAVISSDNNASNLLFSHIVTPLETDSFIRSIAPDTTFRILYSEKEMKQNHDLSYRNHSSPLSAALLIRKVFNEPVVSPAMQDSIKAYLSEVTTGADRLGSVVSDADSMFFAHKTGSGYRNERGELMAHNDVGYFCMPDGRNYAIAVLIRDFNGSEQEASAIIAKISQLVYDHFHTLL